MKETAQLLTFTEEIFNGRLHFLCSVWTVISSQPFEKVSLFATLWRFNTES